MHKGKKSDAKIATRLSSKPGIGLGGKSGTGLGGKSKKQKHKRMLWHLSVVCFMLAVSAVFMSRAFAYLYDDAVEAGQYFESIGEVGSKAEDWVSEDGYNELVPGASGTNSDLVPGTSGVDLE